MIQSVKAAQELSEYTHHVVQVYEIGIDEETELPFMVMEYLEGVTLNSRLYRDPRLNLEQIFEIGLTLCETLAVAHQRNVVHRDIKPENVMLIDRGGSDLFVKLLDFDLVKVDSGEVKTQEGQILGTLEYMSPEQLKGNEIDARADVFSLGAILYECFSGVRANAGKNQRQLVRTLLDQGVRPLEEVAPHLPQEICSLVNRTLSLKPEERPKDASELTRLLRPLQHFKPALSRMSFGLTPTDILLQDEISSTLDGSLDVTHDSLRDHLLTSPGFQDSFESLPVTEDEQSKLHDDLTDIALRDQTPLFNDGSHQTSSSLSISQRPVPRALFLIASLTLGLFCALFYSQRDDVSPQITNSLNPAKSDVKPSEDQHQAQNQEGTEEGTQVKAPPLRALEDLSLLPVPSSTWPRLEIQPHQDPERGLMWAYRGGRLADRLGRLIYDLHFRWREGDPPLEAWTDSDALRWTLLERAPRSSIKHRAGELLISQELRDGLVAQRMLMRHKHAKVADVLRVPQGLIVLQTLSKKCSRLMAGDIIESMRWVVKGKRSLSGSCQGSACLNAHEKSLKRKPSMMRLRLTITVSRAQLNDAIWHREKQSVKCSI
jgi:serine/threonine protein kinase